MVNLKIALQNTKQYNLRSMKGLKPDILQIQNGNFLLQAYFIQTPLRNKEYI